MQKLKFSELSYTEIRRKADVFRKRYWGVKPMPLDVELIAERDFNLAIDIYHDLNTQFDVLGYIDLSKKKIIIDEHLFEHNVQRSRFTIAHELGHIILHEQIYKTAKISSPDEYNSFRNSFTEDEYDSFEWHANTFAGCLLVPTEILVSEYKRILKTNGDMSSLTNKFNVSKKALAYRIKKELDLR